jgi:hypothetical protein
VVLSIDEKPSIQASERAQGYLKLPNGRAMIGQSHDYKRHGTATLFAALNVGTGQIIGKHYKRRRRLEFRDFMNRVVKQYEGKEIHVILDNLSTHKRSGTCGWRGTRTCISITRQRIRRG